MTYSTEAKRAAGAAFISLHRHTIGSKTDFGEALQVSLPSIEHAMIL